MPLPTASSIDTVRALGDIAGFLKQCIQAMPPDPKPEGPGRPRVLPALALWAGLWVCLLRGFQSQRAIWRLLSERGLWFFPRFCVTDQAIYNRLANADTEPLARLFRHINTLLAARLPQETWPNLAPFAEGVVCVDESTLDTMRRKLPALRDVPKGDTRLLPGKMAGVFDVRRQQWHTLQFHPRPCQNEKVAARSLVTDLPEKTLILADLGYFGFAWFDWLNDQNYYWLSRLRAKTSYEVIHTFYQDDQVFDGLVWLGTYRSDRAKYAVRLVTFWQGRTQQRYITNVLDPTLFSLKAIARVYARRWDIEMALALVKQHLHLRLLWSSKVAVIQQQMWATVIIAQILQALRVEIAHKAGVNPFDVSMALLVEYAPRYAYEGRDPIAIFVERGRDLGFIRPSRRMRIRAPTLSHKTMQPAPPGLVLIRTPRYAQRKCARRPKTAQNEN